jgi:cobalt/nickel transport system permease protein
MVSAYMKKGQPRMHIPDGFLDPKTLVATSVFSAAALARALRRVQRHMPPRMVPIMGLSAAFIFVGQMLNFPVVGGTSGHLIGAVLVSVLLGPGAGILVMSIVLVVQCLIFADGGVLALGANVFNMAVVAPVTGYYTYRLLSSFIPGRFGTFVGVAFGSWMSTVLASLCCTGEIAWSGTVAWSLGFPAMTGIHMLIGIGEGLITTLVVAAIWTTRPELLMSNLKGDTNPHSRPLTDILTYGFLVIAGLVLFVTPFASRWPDGLEKTAATFGFDSRALSEAIVPSPIADYQVPGIGSLSAATALAGAIGAAAVFALSFVLAKHLSSKPENASSQ